MVFFRRSFFCQKNCYNAHTLKENRSGFIVAFVVVVALSTETKAISWLRCFSIFLCSLLLFLLPFSNRIVYCCCCCYFFQLSVCHLYHFCAIFKPFGVRKWLWCKKKRATKSCCHGKKIKNDADRTRHEQQNTTKNYNKFENSHCFSAFKPFFIRFSGII